MRGHDYIRKSLFAVNFGQGLIPTAAFEKCYNNNKNGADADGSAGPQGRFCIQTDIWQRE